MSMRPLLIRLDPTLPHGWENVDTLRFGFDSAEVRLHDPSAAAQRFIALLLDGVRSDRLIAASKAAGLTASERHSLFEQLAPVLRFEPIRRAAATAHHLPEVLVRGTGRLAEQLRLSLLEAGFPAPGADEQPQFVVIVERFMQPASQAQSLLAAQIPHLVVKVTDRSLVVGPLVPASGGPCLSCVALHEAQQNPVAAVLAAQLCAMSPGAETDACCRAAGTIVASVLLRWVAGATELIGRRLRFPVAFGSPSFVPEQFVIAPHPECACALQSLRNAA